MEREEQVKCAHDTQALPVSLHENELVCGYHPQPLSLKIFLLYES